MSNITKRYFVFSKAAFTRTGTAKSMRRATTRDEARAHKNGDTTIGIWDTLNNVAIR